MSLYFKRTGYLLLNMFFSIIYFTVCVTLFALGFGLLPIGIGFFVLCLAIFVSDRLFIIDVSLLAGLTKNSDGSPLRVPGPTPIRLRSLFRTKEYYESLLYAVLKLPVSIIQFTLAVMFPVCGFAMLLSPVVYLALKAFGIVIFSDDIVFDTLFPQLSPYERSYIGSGVGLVFLFISFMMVPALIRWSAVVSQSFALLQTTAPTAPTAAQPQEYASQTTEYAPQTLQYTAPLPTYSKEEFEAAAANEKRHLR